jgi:hypothetical protein
MTVILYLIGKAGTGKYTIAKEIEKSGFSLCDNHLINNPIFSLLNLDGQSPVPQFAWDAIERIRDGVFDFLRHETLRDYIITNVLYDIDYDHQIFKKVVQMALDRGSIFMPVKLLISEEENIKRIQNHDRRLRYKSIDVQEVYSEHSLIPISHPNLVELDVTSLSAKEAAERILACVTLAKGETPS